MAQSKSFFGLRTGSTKSHTYQVNKGRQITKDRVSFVSNPQTDGQMKQRLKMAVVSTSRSLLKELINHSFENSNYGEESITEFTRRNLSRDDLRIVEYTPKGITDPGCSDITISGGSLQGYEQTIDNTYLIINGEGSGEEFKGKDGGYAAGDAIDENILQLISKGLNMAPHEQITLLIEYIGDVYEFPTGTDTTANGHYHRFVISRLINNSDRNQQWKVKNKWSNNSEDQDDLVITDGYIDITIDTTGNEFSLKAKPTNDKTICSGSSIKSMLVNGIWRRSPQNMLVAVTETELTYENVLYGYTKTTSNTASAKYLNTGTEGVGISGGTI